MKYCKTCLQPDTRPNTVFDQSGRCPACVYHSSLAAVDWDERREVLVGEVSRVLDRSRHSRTAFDCLLGVSGGKDSTRQALWVRHKLGLNPLLALISYPPQQLTTIGAANVANLMELGFDMVSVAPAPETWRQMMRFGFLTHGNWAKSTELALFAGVPQLAIEMGIPLILWGENPSLQLGDVATAGRSGLDGNQVRFMNTLSGGGNEWLREAGFLESQLIPYRYPSEGEFYDHGLQILFLGWALGDWSLVTNGLYSSLSGLVGRDADPHETGDLFGLTSLDEDFVSVNQMIKYYKFGFGRATDYVNEMIRRGCLTRREAVELVRQYDGACGDQIVESFCEYITISTDTFWETVNRVTNVDLFGVRASGRPVPTFEIGRDTQ